MPLVSKGFESSKTKSLFNSEEDKKSLIEEIKRLVKVMGDIAVHLKDDEPMALGSHQRRQKALTWSVFR